MALISSCCHSVNLLIQKHFPAALAYLADVMSPMQAHCVDIKKRIKGAKTVFIGPCLAKKDEADTSLSSPMIINCFEREEIRFAKDGYDSDEPTKEDALAAVYTVLQPGEPITVEAAEKDLTSMFFSMRRYDLSRVGRYKLNKKLNHKENIEDQTLVREDIIATMKHLIKVYAREEALDDIDHLGNRRVRSVGELMTTQLKTAFNRMERIAKERMSQKETETIRTQDLISIKPVVASIKEFFGSSQLSQFMDQANPLSELTHKRRLSALGPGGLSRDRASFDVRDVHYTHYGRMCPIETPEGPNIGLISYLATYARISEYGFIEAPYRKVDRATRRVTDEVVYMTADVEDNYIIAQANEPLDENHCIKAPRVTCRRRADIIEVDRERVDLIDVAPKMMVSVATASIPFLENDDANRALMGSNMQRQAVPLMITEAPFVATGMEYKAAVDSGTVPLAKDDGIVTRVSADSVTIKYDNLGEQTHKLIKFLRSNQGTCVNQRPIVDFGERVKKGDVIADGASTSLGEISLGKNALIGFMTWEGYNYEDAVLLNEKLVKEDTLENLMQGRSMEDAFYEVYSKHVGQA